MTCAKHQNRPAFASVLPVSPVFTPVMALHQKARCETMRSMPEQPACARSLISIESADGGAAQEATSERETAAVERTAACIAGCRLEDLFADSKFLRAEVHSSAAGPDVVYALM